MTQGKFFHDHCISLKIYSIKRVLTGTEKQHLFDLFLYPEKEDLQLPHIVKSICHCYREPDICMIREKRRRPAI